MKNFDKEILDYHKSYKKQIRFVIIFAFILLFSLGLALFLLPNKIDKTFNAQIAGKIIGLSEYKGNVHVVFKDKKKYVFEKASNYELDPIELYEFIQIGDSIYKPIWSDSLYIYRNNNKYIFILGNITLNLNTNTNAKE